MTMFRSTVRRRGFGPSAAVCATLLFAGCTATPSEEAASMPMDHQMEAAPAASAGTEIPDGDPIPTLTLTQEGVASGAWTFAITTDMSLTLDTAPYQPMLGHVHVYVDGVETQMIADKRFELRDLQPGTYQVSVALADTMHRDLLRNGAKISDGMEIVVPAAD